MSRLSIITAPDSRLTIKSANVDQIDDKLRKFMTSMSDTLKFSSNGVGLAAPQVGINKRVVIINSFQDGERGETQFFVNPKILHFSEETVISEEGCLSVPGYCAEVQRAKSIRLSYLDYDNNQQETSFTGFFSICLQHEIDHLDGILFIDHLSSTKKNIAVRKLKKLKKLSNAANII